MFEWWEQLEWRARLGFLNPAVLLLSILWVGAPLFLLFELLASLLYNYPVFPIRPNVGALVGTVVLSIVFIIGLLYKRATKWRQWADSLELVPAEMQCTIDTVPHWNETIILATPTVIRAICARLELKEFPKAFQPAILFELSGITVAGARDFGIIIGPRPGAELIGDYLLCSAAYADQLRRQLARLAGEGGEIEAACRRGTEAWIIRFRL
jgi:hypothetical protein